MTAAAGSWQRAPVHWQRAHQRAGRFTNCLLDCSRGTRRLPNLPVPANLHPPVMDSASPSMTQMLHIVPDRCTGCMQCELACSWVQTGSFQPAESLIRVNVFDEQASYAPYTCLQCDEAWCMNACPVNAIAIDPSSGAKVVLDALCIGCHLCTIACPFGTVWTGRNEGRATKCNLCGGAPACATACPTRAIEVVPSDGSGSWLPAWGEKVHRNLLQALETSAGS